VISDLGSISRYMPELAQSEIRGGLPAGVGAVRACRHEQGHRWAEQCTAFDEQAMKFDVRFLTEEAGFPYPMRAMHGGWQVEPRVGGSRVTVWWSVTPSVRFVPPWLVVALMGASIDRSFPKLVERMSAAALGRPVQRSSTARPAAVLC
jgi:hypothetical protein